VQNNGNAFKYSALVALQNFQLIPFNGSVNSFSLFDITSVATPLPIILVIARASLINLSTASKNANPSNGIL
jgi:hypothetical protein